LISTRDDSKLSGVLKRTKIRQKGFCIEVFSEKGKKLALINACGKQSRRFALMRLGFHACYSS